MADSAREVWLAAKTPRKAAQRAVNLLRDILLKTGKEHIDFKIMKVWENVDGVFYDREF